MFDLFQTRYLVVYNLIPKIGEQLNIFSIIKQRANIRKIFSFMHGEPNISPFFFFLFSFFFFKSKLESLTIYTITKTLSSSICSLHFLYIIKKLTKPNEMWTTSPSVKITFKVLWRRWMVHEKKLMLIFWSKILESFALYLLLATNYNDQ